MTDEQITNSLNHLAEQKYLRVASRSVCKHAAERIEQLVAINEELEAKLVCVDGELSMTLDELSEVLRSCPDVTLYDVAYMIQKRQEELSQEEPNDDG